MEDKSFDCLTPPSDWQPDPAAARIRFDQRRRLRSGARRVLMPAALVAGTAFAVIMLSADARLAAQHVWQWITLGRIEIVRVNFDDLPDEARSLFAQQLGDTAPPRPVATENEAAAVAGFVPRLPPEGVLPGKPVLTVLAPMVHATTIRIADVELALEKAGVFDLKVPRSWDGAKIQLQIGSAVMAEWPDIALIQAPPAAISASEGLNVAEFAATILRALGMPKQAAERFGQRMHSTPAVLCGIGLDDNAAISDVKLRHGYGTLIENVGDDGRVERVELMWSAGDRLYAFSGATTVDVAITVANSIE
jgi:hypothetical protein